jgi:hypothetical protein
VDKSLQLGQSFGGKHAMILVRTMRFFLQAAQPVPLKGANDIPCHLVTPIQAVGDLLRSIAVSAQPHDEAGFGLMDKTELTRTIRASSDTRWTHNLASVSFVVVSLCPLGSNLIERLVSLKALSS